MISLKDYAAADATELASWVARGEVKPEELIDAALTAIERLNPQANAILQVLGERARSEVAAGLPDGPFRGVPFLLKELVCHAAGVRCDMGSRLSQGYVPANETELMTRFRNAGLVLVGTTQTPELGYNPTTETTLFGPVQNPWKAGHSAGGSSGGSGAAVAAGIVPIAHANDGGGSIRIPASCNGLVGLKPTRDRVPLGPDLGDALCGLAVELVVSRTVRDTALALDAVAGPDVGGPALIQGPARPYRDEMGADTGSLRVAWTKSHPGGGRIDPECARAVERSVAVLEDLGHRCEERAPVYGWDEFLDRTHVIWTAFNAANVDDLVALMGRTASAETLEAVTLAVVEDGRARSASELVHAMNYMNTFSRLMGRFFEDCDLFVTPTMAREPVPHGEVNQNAAQMSAREWTEQVFDYCAFTPQSNSTGQPALSLPLHQSPSGLPVGVQIVGPFGDESLLLRVASQLEEAMPWRDRRPPHHASVV